MEAPTLGGHDRESIRHVEIAVLVSTIAILAVAVAMPIGALVGGPALVVIGIRGRRGAMAAKTPTLVFELSILVGVLLVLFGLVVVGAVSLLLSVSGRTAMPSPSLVQAP